MSQKNSCFENNLKLLKKVNEKVQIPFGKPVVPLVKLITAKSVGFGSLTGDGFIEPSRCKCKCFIFIEIFYKTILSYLNFSEWIQLQTFATCVW